MESAKRGQANQVKREPCDAGFPRLLTFESVQLMPWKDMVIVSSSSLVFGEPWNKQSVG